MTLIKILFFILFYPYIRLGSNYVNTQFNESSGIFYNHLGDTKISNSKLTLLSHINLTQ